MTRIIITLALAGMIGDLRATQGAQRKPIRSESPSITYAAPPEGLRAMREAADAVAVVRYDGQAETFERESVAPGVTFVFTRYSVEIAEVLKSHSQLPLAGGVVQFVADGGDLEHETHIRRSMPHPGGRLKDGKKYVVFLKWHANTNSFILPWGPASLYDVTSGKVMPLSDSTEKRPYHGVHSTEFITKIRQGH